MNEMIEERVMESGKILQQAKQILRIGEEDINALVDGELDVEDAEELRAAFRMVEEYEKEKESALECGFPSIRMLKFLPALELLESEKMKHNIEFHALQRHLAREIEWTELFLKSKLGKNDGTEAADSPIGMAASGQSVDKALRSLRIPQINMASEDGKYKVSWAFVKNRFEFYLYTAEEDMEKLDGTIVLRLQGLPEITLEDGIGELKFDGDVDRCFPAVLEFQNGDHIPLEPMD